MHTSHWGMIGLAAMEFANRALSAISGHTVDLNAVDYGTVIPTLVLSYIDKFQRYKLAKKP